MVEPLYEIWGEMWVEVRGGETGSRVLGFSGCDVHLEDCVTLAEASKAVLGWQESGYAAWIADKETGYPVDL